jgi:hypothetical protein
MNKKILLSIMLLFIISFYSFSNSAQPPNLRIIIPFYNKSISMSLTDNYNNELTGYNIEKQFVFEKHFVFYLVDYGKIENIVLKIELNNEKYYIPVEKTNARYNNIFTLDLKNMAIRNKDTFLRQFVDVFSRFILTLILEFSVLLIMGYKNIRSYKLFFI